MLDDSIHDSGVIAGGWSLEITVLGQRAAPAIAAGVLTSGRGSRLSHTDNDGDADEATEAILKELSANKTLITVESLAVLPTGQVRLVLFGQAGQRYAVQTTTDFAAWQELQTGTASADLFEVIDSQASQFRQRFYRAVVSP